MTLSAETQTIAGRDEWLAAHQAHLTAEKEFTHQREAMAAARRKLPWLEITDNYRFTSAEGEHTLLDLFGDLDQLIVYHFMFGPDWDEGCPSCSFWADSYQGSPTHLAQRNTAFAAVSRASVAQIEAYQKRMGWDFRWLSSGDSSFNFDLGVSSTPEEIANNSTRYNHETASSMGEESAGISVFARDGDRVFLTHQVFARGLDLLNGTYHLLDLTPLGRDEADLPFSMAWLRRRDSYDS